MIAVWLLSALVVAQAEEPAHASELDQAMAVLSQLDAVSLSVEYRQQLLEDVMEDLSARVSIPMRGDWPSLARLGVDPDDRVTLRSNPSSAASVMASLTLTIGEEFERPVFEIHAGQIVLTTVEGSAAMRLTGVYDVRDLLADHELIQRLRDEAPPVDTGHAPAQPDKPAANETPKTASPPPPQDPARLPPNPLSPANTDRQGGRPALIPELKFDDPAVREVKPPTPAEDLYTLITDHVDPEAWMNFGGNRALVSDRNGVLIVTATPSTHRRFREALALLRRANPKSIAIEAAIMDLPRSSHEQIMRKHSGNSVLIAGAVRTDPKTIVVWQTSGGVALDAPFDVESKSSDTTVHVALTAHCEKDSGLLTIDIKVETRQGDDTRSLNTTASLLSDDGPSIMELPAAKPSDSIRLLVLTPRRR